MPLVQIELLGFPLYWIRCYFMAKHSGKKLIRKTVLDKFKSRCAYCGDKITIQSLTIDHIIPKRRGMDSEVKGPDHLDNYNPACQSCNMSKSSMDLEKWRHELKLKTDRLIKNNASFRILIRYKLLKIKNTTIVFHFEKIKPNV